MPPARNEDLHGNAPDQSDVAVVLIDVINDLEFEGGDRLLRDAVLMARHVAALAARARRAGIPVIYANDNLGSWRSDAPALIAHCTGPRAGAGLVKSLAPAAGDEIVLKPRHSAFFGTALEALLDDHRVGTLLLTGISAESCVWMTACDAHTRGFRLVSPLKT